MTSAQHASLFRCARESGPRHVANQYPFDETPVHRSACTVMLINRTAMSQYLASLCWLKGSPHRKPAIERKGANPQTRTHANVQFTWLSEPAENPLLGRLVGGLADLLIPEPGWRPRLRYGFFPFAHLSILSYWRRVCSSRQAKRAQDLFLRSL